MVFPREHRKLCRNSNDGAETHPGHTVRKPHEEVSSELCVSTWVSILLSLGEATGYFKGYNCTAQYPRHSAGWVCIPSWHATSAPWLLHPDPALAFSPPLFLSHSVIPTSSSNYFSASIRICEHTDLLWLAVTNKDGGRKACREARVRELAGFLEVDLIQIKTILETQLEASPSRGKSTYVFQSHSEYALKGK